ncbi:serine hydrolase [Streptomyces sp. NPDC088124]|uniref:serine hydrolase n=1 Tax=Streptomyces sp. NPDC088124 TaxID=3154654 RepID=UPI003429714B
MSRHRHAPSARGSLPRRAAFPAAAAAVVCLTVWTATGFPSPVRGDSDAVPRSGGLSRSATAALESPSAASSATSSRAAASSRTVDPDQVLTRRLAALPKPAKASVSVALIDLKDGREADYGVGTGKALATYDTASIVKVNILVALLLQAQDEHRALTAVEKSRATKMIKVSDNESANALWRAIGKGDGLDAANRRLGMTGTTAGSGPLWGLTQSTAADQIALLSAVFGGDATSPLTAASRAYVRSLMGGIEPGQDWGVSAAGTVTGLKNGWLSRSATGLWDVNSIGRIVVDGHSYLLAVLSRGSVSMEAGISLVEKAATTAVSASREWT